MDSRLVGLMVVLASAACPAVALAGSVYAVNNSGDNVSQYDAGPSGALSPKTPTAVATGSGPYGIAMTPDGRSAYVAASGDDVVWQYDVLPGGGLAPKTPHTVSSASAPDAVAVSPDGRSLYASASSGFVSQYDIGPDGRLTPKFPANVAAGTAPEAVAVSPDGRSVYVANQVVSGTISQFDVGAGGVLTPKNPPTVPAGNTPAWLALTPDGHSLYVTNEGDTTIGEYDVGPTGLLSPKTPATVSAGPGGPTGIAVAPDGHSAYVTNFGGTSTSVSQFDIGAGQLLSAKTPGSVSGLQGPYALAVSPDSRSVYVTNYLTSGLVSQFDIASGGLLSPKSPASVAAGNRPYVGIVVTPDQAPVARFSATPAPPGSGTRFNATGSSDPDGVVARYDWDFGDGSGAPNGGATPTHVYRSVGSYTVTLTVSDEIGCGAAMIFTGQTAYCSGGAGAQSAQRVAVTADTSPPRLSALRLKPTAFSAAKSGPSATKVVGTTVSYRVSEAATTKFTVERPARGVKRGKRCVKPGKGTRKGHRCTRYMRLRGSFTHRDAAGSNKLRFRGRLARHAIRPGRYRLVATPRDAAGNKGKPARRAFRIVR